MRNLLYPKIPKQHLSPLFKSACIGLLIAGVYGVVHDLSTFSIGPEYFTRYKFDQFDWMNFGQSGRAFAAMVGFVASGVVGFFAAWFLGRVSLPRHPLPEAEKRIKSGIVIIFLLASVGAISGYTYGIVRGPEADFSFWNATVEPLGIADRYPFIRVAYIHNGSYLGAVIGSIIAIVRAR